MRCHSKLRPEPRPECSMLLHSIRFTTFYQLLFTFRKDQVEFTRRRGDTDNILVLVLDIDIEIEFLVRSYL